MKKISYFIPVLLIIMILFTVWQIEKSNNLLKSLPSNRTSSIQGYDKISSVNNSDNTDNRRNKTSTGKREKSDESLTLPSEKDIESLRQQVRLLKEGIKLMAKIYDPTLDLGQESFQNEADFLQKELELLENVIIPDDPLETAELWAKGKMNRNGALQFLLFSSELKKREYAFFESNMWVTGTSSPWITDYSILRLSENKFKAVFSLATSTGFFGTEEYIVSTEEREGKYYISQIDQSRTF